MPKPRIGVCTPHRGGLIPWIFFWLNIRLAGGTPVRITPHRPLPQREETTRPMLDGLIVGGGADIAPNMYGEKEQLAIKINTSIGSATLAQYFYRWLLLGIAFLMYILRRVCGLKQSPQTAKKEAHKRDALEAPLIQAALEHNIPVLGVCRGMQLLNVVLGGTLHQEIADVYEDVRHPYTVLPHKRIKIQRCSKLAHILRRTTTKVNALHHQSINKLGEGLCIVAQSQSGIVEAIETQGTAFVLGVQWHPEFMIQFKSQRRIFHALVDASIRQ